MLPIQVSKCYTTELAEFPGILVSLLERHATVLDGNMRWVEEGLYWGVHRIGLEFGV